MIRESFVFYKSWMDAIKNLPRDVQGEVLTAIAAYGLYGETTEHLKPIANAIFQMAKPQIDANNRRYENGIKGGRPTKKSKPNQNQKVTKTKPRNIQEITEVKPNDNDNENESFIEENIKEDFSKFEDKPLAELYHEMKSNDSWSEQFVMNKRSSGYKQFTQETLSVHLDEFFRELQNRGETQRTLRDVYIHFSNWMNVKLEKDRNNENTQSTRGLREGNSKKDSGLRIL